MEHRIPAIFSERIRSFQETAQNFQERFDFSRNGYIFPRNSTAFSTNDSISTNSIPSWTGTREHQKMPQSYLFLTLLARVSTLGGVFDRLEILIPKFHFVLHASVHYSAYKDCSIVRRRLSPIMRSRNTNEHLNSVVDVTYLLASFGAGAISGW